jgi:predicted DNA-binding transcriptional regulator YafY
VARKLVAGLEQTPLAEAAESALGKLSRALPAELAERAARAGAGVSATLRAEHDYGQKGSAVRALVDAIERQETVQLQYRKRSVAQRSVDPYLLHVQAGAVYLIGFCHLRNGVRTFLLDRVREAKSTGAVFAAKAPFSPAAVLQGALGPWQGEAQRMKLRFDAEVADLVAERRVHPSQRSQWTSEGELDVELRAPVCPPLLAWLLGWGEHVRVVSPEALARKLRRRHTLASK